IQKLEDPTGYLDIKNSVTIASKPISPSKPDAFPRAVTGVAIWDDVNPDATQFSIFISGLSNGWSEAKNLRNGERVVLRKTLQLNFRRLGDRYYQDSSQIRFQAPVQWLYRGSRLTAPKDAAPARPPKDAAAAPKPPAFLLSPPDPPLPKTTTTSR